MNYVVDTGALSLYYAGDDRVRPFFAQIADGRAHGYIASTNLAEHCYKVCQKQGRETATVRFHQTQTILELVLPDADLAKAAGLTKCRYNGLSLADAFAAALAERLRGTLLTTDEALLEVKAIHTKHFKI